ncbi:MAG: AsnC family transcriptional regulator [Stappia sp.]|jgi:Lrp/AsnC family transcriptional regulator|uniref:Lrp/AsnC family transcriptional regulator n=1 Tax=Stappia sp. TaxID=1870903 RepID=UPI000C4549E4|nr:Lrp/AsnC family transcriptional regulator [Stappia sp.]MAB00386.1 AsnC family transcriptional regulator [Stappia sp.]MBM19801.1 AsnC family transcriptional regulator [Stappia sp.]|tara:strand:- start:498 stop:977 length:480 start_codon:yes stop_codon:yes gene_type:complete
MSEKTLLDPSDIRVLKILQRDASLSIAEVAREAGMSQTPCWRRIKKLKESGVIRQTVAVVDSEAVGLGFVAYAFVKLAVPSRENMETFDKLVYRWPEVVICERITGAVDYLIKVVASDIKAYDDFLRLKLLDNAMVSDVQSRIVVNTVKQTVALPLRES